MHFVFLATFLRTHSDLPLLEPEGRFRKQDQYRQMSDGSDGGGGEHEDQKELDWNVQTNER